MIPAVGAAAPLRFDLPPDLSATEPPEATGARRDGVRLLASWRRTGEVAHRRFADLPDLLAPGDVVVVNTSGTLAAAVPAERAEAKYRISSTGKSRSCRRARMTEPTCPVAPNTPIRMAPRIGRLRRRAREGLPRRRPAGSGQAYRRRSCSPTGRPGARASGFVAPHARGAE